jgi:hypothetical protein
MVAFCRTPCERYWEKKRIDDFVRSREDRRHSKKLSRHRRDKARESCGMRRTEKYAAMTKKKTQRRSSDPDSAGRWTFYEAVKN